MPGAQYTATCNANVASGYSSLQLAISDSSFAALATELTEEASGVNGTMSASATAPATAANGVITLYIDEQGTFDNCQVIVGSAAYASVSVSFSDASSLITQINRKIPLIIGFTVKADL